ncbi:MAG: hypothetical protein ACYTHJ_06850 [Planctomycetota bacterium]|jgi:hypothetical protein
MSFDLRPDFHSPCIDAGTNIIDPHLIPDIAGQPRTLCGNTGVGVYEFTVEVNCDHSTMPISTAPISTAPVRKRPKDER